VFPPYPKGLKGRRQELATLASVIGSVPNSRIALVGGGGSGKSMLACALGYRVKRSFPGGVHWFRSGPWDERTLAEMLAIRFGRPRDRASLLPELSAAFLARGPTLVVLDNHENDRAVAGLLNHLEGSPVTWIVTARRCLLGGVYVFPVVAPLVTRGKSAFPRVAPLARILRYSPLALGVADGLVRSGAVSVDELRDWLIERGVERVRVIAHEDDLPEVALLVEWAWPRLIPEQRRVLAVLGHSQGDHMDAASLCVLGAVPSAQRGRALAGLAAWNLIQEPLPGRYALHAVIRHAVVQRVRFQARRILDHYVDLLERDRGRLDLEQTHLYAAMDFAHEHSNLALMLRIERLVASLAEGA
jgi:hypothetical protein